MTSLRICKDSRVLVLASSGMDSLLLMGLAAANRNDVQPLFVDCGFPWERAERQALYRIIRELHDPTIPEPLTVRFDATIAAFQNSWMHGSEVPQWENGILTNTILGRNVYLLAIAFTVAANRGIQNVVLGITSHSYVDAQRPFLASMTEAMNSGLNTAIALHTPLPDSKNEDVVAFVAAHPRLPWHLTFSCYRPAGNKPCHSCYKCTERAAKLLRWGINLE